MFKMNKEQKLIVLRLIEENKAVLFGDSKRNASTSDQKQKIWKDIVRKCRDLHGFDATNGHDWQYLRGKTWDHWKRNIRGKLDGNNRKTTRETELNEIDMAVLNILGQVVTEDGSLQYQNINEDTAEAAAVNDQEQDEYEPVTETTRAVTSKLHNYHSAIRPRRGGAPTQVVNHQSIRSLPILRQGTNYQNQPRVGGVRVSIRGRSMGFPRAGGPVSTIQRGGSSSLYHTETRRSDVPMCSLPSGLHTCCLDDEMRQEAKRNLKLQNDLLEAQINYWKLKSASLQLGVGMQAQDNLDPEDVQE